MGVRLHGWTGTIRATTAQSDHHCGARRCSARCFAVHLAGDSERMDPTGSHGAELSAAALSHEAHAASRAQPRIHYHLECDRIKLMRSPPSLPGLTPKSGVPDFGAFRITKVGNIRLWCNPSLCEDDGPAGQALR